MNLPIQLASFVLAAIAVSAPPTQAGIPVGTPWCAGDGSSIACPCGNFSAPASGEGCANSLGVGALLTAVSTTGATSVGGDMGLGDLVVLGGTQMPNGAAVYFTGTPLPAVPFGDGLRCVGNPSQVKLGIKVNVLGASQFPDAADLAQTPTPYTCGGQSWMTTALPAPCTRGYQIWYRSAAPFCTAATFNLSNALAIAWTI